MKKLCLATLVLAVMMLVTLSSTARADVTLNNAGFESPGAWWASPDWWSVGGSADAKGTTMSSYEGEWGFSVANDWGGTTDNADGFAVQDITGTFTADLDAIFKMYIKTDVDYTGEAKLKLEFLDSGDGVLGEALSSTLTGVNDWTLATAAGAIPDGTVKLKAYCISENMGIGSKLAHFDDGSLDVVPEPTSLLLLGSGLVGLLGFAWRKRK